MSIQLELFPQPKLPPWWTDADTELCRDHNAQQARTDYPHDDESKVEAYLDTLHPRTNEYTCRRCCGFESPDGVTGFCWRNYRRARWEFEESEPNQDDDFLEPWEPTAGEYQVRGKDQCEEWGPKVR